MAQLLLRSILRMYFSHLIGFLLIFIILCCVYISNFYKIEFDYLTLIISSITSIIKHQPPQKKIFFFLTLCFPSGLVQNPSGSHKYPIVHDSYIKIPLGHFSTAPGYICLLKLHLCYGLCKGPVVVAHLWLDPSLKFSLLHHPSSTDNFSVFLPGLSPQSHPDLQGWIVFPSSSCPLKDKFLHPLVPPNEGQNFSRGILLEN